MPTGEGPAMSARRLISPAHLRLIRVVLGVILGTTLVATMNSQAGAAAPKAAPDDKVFTPRQEQSVPVVITPVIPRKPDPVQAKLKAAAKPAGAWPSPGVADVAV